MPQKSGREKLPDLYTDLADWFHLLTAPEGYKTHADFYREIITRNCQKPPRTLLELGSGGGNNASHLKSHFKMTLVDLSEQMLAVSRRINPACEHIPGDMRNVRLGRQFDAVFIHDAVSYLTTESDLSLAIETAFVHCKPGGVALFAPDYTRETFTPATNHGGHDAGNRGLRYLEWVWDPDPADTSYIMDMVYLMKDGENIRCRSDRHTLGFFNEDVWRKLINKAGFSVKLIKRKADWSPPMGTRLFLGIKPE
jgi:hypothetical protein